MSQDKNAFIVAVVSRILHDMPPKATAEDRETLAWAAERAWDNGLSVFDAETYCRTFEEVDPDLDEDVALRRRLELSAKYAGKSRVQLRSGDEL